MTREEAKVLLPIIQAFAEGKKILVKDKRLSDAEYNWSEVDDCSFNMEQFKYRIKPEPKYRPFKDAEECWNEMQKHQPFGWIKNCGVWYNIVSTDVASVNIINTRGAIATLYFRHLLANYHFADGALFDIKEEE